MSNLDLHNKISHFISLIYTYATEQNISISTAESCTGGLIASYLTSLAGASAFYNCGFITYSNQSKIDILGVSANIIEKYGAVSLEVANEMANLTAKKTGSDIVLAVTGIAGPSGGTVDKPVGTLCFAILDRHTSIPHTSSHIIHFEGDRNEIQKKAALQALEFITQSLLAIKNKSTATL